MWSCTITIKLIMVLIQYPIDYYSKPGNQNFESLTFFSVFHIVSEKPRRKKNCKTNIW